MQRKKPFYWFSSSNFILSNSTPVPSTTHVRGLSAVNTGTFNVSSSNSLNPVNNAPPPVKIIPFPFWNIKIINSINGTIIN